MNFQPEKLPFKEKIPEKKVEGKTRFFDVIIGYCPYCKENQFFSNIIGISGKCPICGKLVINIFAGKNAT